MNGTKRLLSFLMIILIVAVVSVAGTLAFISSSDTVTNRMVFGDITVELKDLAIPDPSQTIGGAVPGSTITTKPYITNVSSGNDKKDTDCYVRATLTVTASGGESSSSAPIQKYIEFLKDSTSDKWDWSAYTQGSTQPITIFYKEALPSGRDTQPMYNGVWVKTTAEGLPLLQGVRETFGVLIDVQAVQTVKDGQVVDYRTAFSMLDA